MEKKTKTAKFLENVGLGIGMTWMLTCMLPILTYEGIGELFKRKSKEPQPESIKFVCSECGETFTSENEEKTVEKDFFRSLILKFVNASAKL